MTNNKIRDAEIWALRKTGQTLNSIGDAYRLSKERIREICARQERIEKFAHYHSDDRIKTPDQELSGRAYSIVAIQLNDPDWSKEDLIQAGLDLISKHPNCGKKHLRELQFWLDGVENFRELSEIMEPSPIDLHLSMRTINVISHFLGHEKWTLEDVAQIDLEQLIRTPHCGIKSINEIKELLSNTLDSSADDDSLQIPKPLGL